MKLNKSDRVFEINRLKLKIKYYENDNKEIFDKLNELNRMFAENEEKLSYVKNELKKDLEKLEKGN